MKGIHILKNVLKCYGDNGLLNAKEQAKYDLIEMIRQTPADRLVTVDEREHCYEIEINCRID